MFAAAKAWDIDGASDASSTAQHAIQTVKHLANRFFPIEN
jgi:hypothetical protein